MIGKQIYIKINSSYFFDDHNEVNRILPKPFEYYVTFLYQVLWTLNTRDHFHFGKKKGSVNKIDKLLCLKHSRFFMNMETILQYLLSFVIISSWACNCASEWFAADKCIISVNTLAYWHSILYLEMLLSSERSTPTMG